MPREFELHKEIEIEATPEQVWDAIATGPGIDSWYMGPHTVEPGEDGKISLTIGEFSEQATITAWDPGKRLAYRGGTAPDGSFHAMEYLIEGRDGGSTVLRFVHNGFVSDDWGTEYEDMTSYGWTMYFHTLNQYLTHFRHPGVFVSAEGPKVAEDVDSWTVLSEALGLPDSLAQGDKVHLTPESLPPIDGVADYAVPGYRGLLGIRDAETLYRFHGHSGQIAVGHHVFTKGADAAVIAKAWHDWLARVYA